MEEQVDGRSGVQGIYMYDPRGPGVACNNHSAPIIPHKYRCKKTEAQPLIPARAATNRS